MTTVDRTARGTKRRTRNNAHAMNVDLSLPPLERTSLEGTSRLPGRRNAQQQVSSQPNSLGSNSSLIDLEATEDEVQVLSSSRGFPQRRNRSKRNQPVTVVLDEDLEIRTSGPVTTLSLTTSSKPEASSMDKPVIVCDLYPDKEEKNPKGKAVMIPEPVKEPTFTCPVCLNSLVEPSSTICGHIFCKSCIRASIQAQKKCPTCRRKLTMSNFHPVFLPDTD